MTTPFFSIVIPTYNSSRFLRTCLSSIAGQTEKDYEVIVVDKHSKDDTLHILDTFCFPKFKVIFQNSQTLPEALDEGFKICSGSILCWLNSDDAYCRPDALKMVRSAYHQGPPGATFIYANHFCIDDQETIINLSSSHWQTTKHEPSIGPLNLCTGALFFSPQLYHCYGKFGSTYRLAFEYPFIDYLFLYGHSVFLPIYLHAYRLHLGQLSSASSNAMHEECERIDALRYKPNILERFTWLVKRFISRFTYSNFIYRAKWKGASLSAYWSKHNH